MSALRSATGTAAEKDAAMVIVKTRIDAVLSKALDAALAQLLPVPGYRAFRYASSPGGWAPLRRLRRQLRTVAPVEQCLLSGVVCVGSIRDIPTAGAGLPGNSSPNAAPDASGSKLVARSP